MRKEASSPEGEGFRSSPERDTKQGGTEMTAVMAMQMQGMGEMDDMGGMMGMGIFMMLIPPLVIIVLVLLIVYLFKAIRK